MKDISELSRQHQSEDLLAAGVLKTSLRRSGRWDIDPSCPCFFPCRTVTFLGRWWGGSGSLSLFYLSFCHILAARIKSGFLCLCFVILLPGSGGSSASLLALSLSHVFGVAEWTIAYPFNYIVFVLGSSSCSDVDGHIPFLSLLSLSLFMYGCPVTACLHVVSLTASVTLPEGVDPQGSFIGRVFVVLKNVV